MKQLVSLIVALLALVISAGAQAVVQQSRIVDIDGKGVPDVAITETATCSPTAAPLATATKSYVTDADGKFTWPQLGAPGPGSGCAVSLSYNFALSKAG